MDLLRQHAWELGIEVVIDDLGPHRRGKYLDDEALIVISPKLTHSQAIATLAHELGHAIYRDRCSEGWRESRADEMGASLIITPTEYAEAESIAGCHPTAMARELGVTGRLVIAWQRWYARKGGERHGLVREAA